MSKPVGLSSSRKVYVARSRIPDAGRGVFAAQSITKGEIIETCPVIELHSTEIAHIKQTALQYYYFLWGRSGSMVAIALGFGSLYNHSYEPNATYKKHPEEQSITFVALRNIAKDEEITTNYNAGKADDKSTLWIKSIKPEAASHLHQK